MDAKSTPKRSRRVRSVSTSSLAVARMRPSRSRITRSIAGIISLTWLVTRRIARRGASQLAHGFAKLKLRCKYQARSMVHQTAVFPSGAPTRARIKRALRFPEEPSAEPAGREVSNSNACERRFHMLQVFCTGMVMRKYRVLLKKPERTHIAPRESVVPTPVNPERPMPRCVRNLKMSQRSAARMASLSLCAPKDNNSRVIVLISVRFARAVWPRIQTFRSS